MTLQIATSGHLPLCPKGLVSNGFISCGTAQAANTGGWGDYRYLNPPDWSRDVGEQAREAVIARSLPRVEVLGDAEVEIPSPQGDVLPAFNPTPLDEIESDLDRELAILLRLRAIRWHNEYMKALVEEQRFLEESLMVLLALDD